MLNFNRFISNIKKALPIAVLPVALSSCAPVHHPVAVPRTAIAPLASTGSTMLCRDRQCTPTALNMTKEYVMNSIHKLLESNVGQDVFFCEADANTRHCLNDFIEYPMLVGATPGTMRLDRARLLDARATNIANKVEFVLDYNFYFNGIKAQCNPSVNVAYAKSPDYIVMEDAETTCRLTTNYASRSSHLYTVDFIDLDYGMVGAYYSLGMSGVAYGGKGGYMIMRFPNGIKYPGNSANYKRPAANPMPAQAATSAPVLMPTANSVMSPAPMMVNPVVRNAPVILNNNPYPRKYYNYTTSPYMEYSSYYSHSYGYPMQNPYFVTEHHKDARSISPTRRTYTSQHPYYSMYDPLFGYSGKPMFHNSYDHIPLATSK